MSLHACTDLMQHTAQSVHHRLPPLIHYWAETAGLCRESHRLRARWLTLIFQVVKYRELLTQSVECHVAMQIHWRTTCFCTTCRVSRISEWGFHPPPTCRDLPQEATHTWWMSAFAPAVIIIGITLSSWFGGRKYGLSCLVFKVSQRGGAVIYTVFHPVNIWSNASVRRQMLPGAVPPCLLPSKTNKVQMNG